MTADGAITMNEKVERVGEALRKECLEIFGSTWSNDIAWRLARVAIEAFEKPEPPFDMADYLVKKAKAADCHLFGAVSHDADKTVFLLRNAAGVAQIAITGLEQLQNARNAQKRDLLDMRFAKALERLSA